MTYELDSELNRLPEPAPPAGMAAAIMSRTAHHEEKRPVASRESPRVAPAKAQKSDWRAWTVLLAGVAVGLGAQAYRLLAGESTLHLTSPFLRGGMEGLVEMPHASPAVLVLAAGLLLYVAGLFAVSARPTVD